MFLVVPGWTIFGWYIFKSLQTREFKHIAIALFFVLLELTQWPFFLDYRLMVMIYGCSFAIFLGIEQYVNKKIASSWLYVGGFTVLGLISLVHFFLKQ